MDADSTLSIEYATHERVRLLEDLWRYHLEHIALEFGRWGESRIFGPGMYVAIVVGPSIEGYADPMGDNRWPNDGTRGPFYDADVFASAVAEVAFSCDGAVVVSVDGIASRQLVGFTSVDRKPDLSYAPWMGSRHMSALDISTRGDVISTLTLSQESGRVTVFKDGTFESFERDELGGRYRTT